GNMTLALILLLGHLVALYGDDTVFNCVDTDEGCPSKMCFYSIDHEKRCYRAGCASEELCHRRRNNECFMSDAVHTCCCFEAGCAAGYKGLNDCIDVQKNSTDAVTSVTDVATTRLTTTAGISAIVQSNAKEQTSTPAKKSPTTLTEGAPAATTRKSTESPTSSVKQQDSTETTITVLHPVTSRVQTASTSSTVPGTTTYYIPTRAIMFITNTNTITESFIPPAFTTTISTSNENFLAPSEELQPLPVLPHSENAPGSPRNGRMPNEFLTTAARSTKLYPSAKVESFAEQRKDTGSIFSPAMRINEQPIPQESLGKSSKRASEETNSTSSLISVYEVTTQAVKNKEMQEEWKAPLPWWSAAVLGFLVSVIVAWVVVLILRKRRAHESETRSRSARKGQGLVDPLLRTTDENSRLSDSSPI
uniref:Secreted protein n=1 Tax=Haemonchus contortus TaxID=6289 RepID=A0A7I4Z5X7_HAECO